MEITLNGSLGYFAVPEILMFLNLNRKSGNLSVTSGGREAVIFFDEGAVVYARSNQDKLRLGSILQRKKKITPEQRQRIDRRMLESDAKFGKIAIDEGALGPDELIESLKVQVSEIVYDCYLWSDGTFSLTFPLEVPDYAVTISMDLCNLIMEGARRIDEWEECLQLLPDATVVFRVALAPEAGDRITLAPEEWNVLFRFNGVKTLQQVSEEIDAEPLEVYRIVHGLHANKLIEIVPRTTEKEPTGERAGDDRSLLLTRRGTLTFRDLLGVSVGRLTLKGREKVTYPLVDPEYRIGRVRSNQIQLSDPVVSAVHARIYRVAGGYMVEDLGSRNGTWVNEIRVEQTLLTDNDIIRIGDTELVYSIVSGGKAPDAPTTIRRPAVNV